MNDAEERKWKKIWLDRKYEILEGIHKASPRKASDRRRGMSVSDLSDLVGIPPHDIPKFVDAMVDWGANIHVRDNCVQTLATIAVTEGTYENPFKLRKIEIFGQKVRGLRIGVASDTHFGSTRANYPALRAAYRRFEQEGIRDVVHVGNILAGKAPKKFVQADRLTEDFEKQLELFLRYYPKHSGITTHYILGHSDITFGKEGINPAQFIRSERKDFKDKGVLEADLVFEPGENKKPFILRLYNERLMYYYSISYQAQKKLENMAGGEKPAIWLVGGTQQVWQGPYQGVEVYKLPGLQNQTMQMRDRAYLCNVGFGILSVVPEAKGVKSLMDFVPILKGGPKMKKRGD